MYSIDWVSTLLPLGNYKLSVEGKIIEMQHSKDGWVRSRPHTPNESAR